MSLIQNKYSQWYHNIINKALSENRKKGGSIYYERHHILPKSLYPDKAKDKDNLVLLTAREHYICHYLLIKMTYGHDRRLMLYALGAFQLQNNKVVRNITARQYEQIRKAISVARTGVMPSESTRLKMSQKGKGRVPWNKGVSVIPSREAIIKGANTRRGKKLTKEHSDNIAKGKLGKPSGMLGKKHSEETKQKMRESYQKKREEISKKISLSRIGMKFTDEHKKNISLSQQARAAEISQRRKGMKFTDEHKANISKAKAGKIHKPHSLETKEKIRQAKLAYYAQKRIEKVDRTTEE